MYIKKYDAVSKERQSRTRTQSIVLQKRQRNKHTKKFTDKFKKKQAKTDVQSKPSKHTNV